MKKPSPTPEAPPPSPPPEPDSVLGMHHRNLQSLTVELDALQRLSDMWGSLAKELEAAEAQIGDTVSAILLGESDDVVFNEKSIRIASLSAQLTAIKKRAISSGTALQTRLQKDCVVTEWLVQNWLDHRILVERTRVLESVCPERRGALKEPAERLAEASTAYQQSIQELGTAAPVSFAWTRPIEPLSEKSLLSQKLYSDPLYKAPTAQETLVALLDAGRVEKARWSAILIAVGLDPAFAMPPYEQPEVQVWTPSKAEAGIVSGPPTPGIPLENPAQKRIHYGWEAEELSHPPWEQSKASA